MFKGLAKAASLSDKFGEDNQCGRELDKDRFLSIIYLTLLVCFAGGIAGRLGKMELFESASKPEYAAFLP